MIEGKDLYFTYPTGVEALERNHPTVDNGEFLAIMGQTFQFKQ